MTSTKDLSAMRDALRSLLKNLTQQGDSMRGRVEAEHRQFTEAEQVKVDAIFAKFETTEAELRAVERELVDAEVLENRAAELDNAIATAGRRRVTAPTPLHDDRTRTSGGPRFGQMFPQASMRRERHDFADVGQFAKAVFQRDPKLYDVRNASGASEGVGADGGFYVPVQFYAGIMDDSLQGEAIRPGATIVPMQSSTIDLPMFDLHDRSTGIATMEGKVTGEGVTGTTQHAKVRTTQLVAKKIQVLVPTTLELLQDAPQLFNTLLQQAMTDALGQTLDTWFISGGGAGVPLGILNAPCTVSQAKDTSQVAATITPSNVANMVSRLAPGSWARATWIVSPSALTKLFTMTNVVTNVAGTENVGGWNPAWFQSNSDGTFTLLGRPLIVSDRCAALGTVGDILLVDRRSYLIGLRQDATLDVSTQIGFKESEVWFRLNCRIDGQPALAAPITPRVGSTTLSPFVSLATRS